MSEPNRIKYGTGREMLLEATVRVVAEHGLHGMTFRKVAGEAGVNNSLVAHHFGSLQALAAAALEWSAATATRDSHLPTFAESEEDYREALVSTLRSQLGTHVYQFEMVLEASRDASLRPRIRAMYDAYVDRLAEGLFGPSASPDERAVARVVFSAIDGLVLQFVGGAIDVEEFAEQVDAAWRIADKLRTTPVR